MNCTNDVQLNYILLITRVAGRLPSTQTSAFALELADNSISSRYVQRPAHRPRGRRRITGPARSLARGVSPPPTANSGGQYTAVVVAVEIGGGIRSRVE